MRAFWCVKCGKCGNRVNKKLSRCTNDTTIQLSSGRFFGGSRIRWRALHYTFVIACSRTKLIGYRVWVRRVGRNWFTQPLLTCVFGSDANWVDWFAIRTAINCLRACISAVWRPIRLFPILYILYQKRRKYFLIGSYLCKQRNNQFFNLKQSIKKKHNC